MSNCSMCCTWLFTSCRKWLRMVTVEPVLFLFTLAGAFMWPTVQALTYRKVCLREFNVTICDNLDHANASSEEDVVQTITSFWFLARIYIEELPSILTAIFYGNLSDHVSRKVAMMLPILGMILASVVYLLNGMFMDWPVGCIVIGSVFSGLCGGWITCALAVYSYISDVSDKESRTMRMAAIEVVLIVGSVIGNSLSGKLLDSMGFTFVLSMSTGFWILDALYIQYFISDTRRADEGQTKSVKSVLHDVFSPSRVKQAASVVFKKRPNKGRLYIILLLVSLCFAILGGSNSWIVGYLFLKRQPLSWTQSLYGYYVGVGHMVRGVVVMVIFPIMKNVLHMSEILILIIGSGLHAVAETVFGLSTKTWMVFFTVGIDFLHGTLSVCFRSLLSLLVEPHEFGQIFAALGSLQSVSVLISSAVYNNIYPLTLDIWAGMCFVMGAVLLVIEMILLIWIYVDQKRQNQKTDRTDTEEEALLTTEHGSNDKNSDQIVTSGNDSDAIDTKLVKCDDHDLTCGVKLNHDWSNGSIIPNHDLTCVAECNDLTGKTDSIALGDTIDGNRVMSKEITMDSDEEDNFDSCDETLL